VLGLLNYYNSSNIIPIIVDPIDILGVDVFKNYSLMHIKRKLQVLQNNELHINDIDIIDIY